jgi:hypothetical protein
VQQACPEKPQLPPLVTVTVDPPPSNVSVSAHGISPAGMVQFASTAFSAAASSIAPLDVHTSFSA